MLRKHFVLPMWRLRVRQRIASGGQSAMERIGKVTELGRVLQDVGANADRSGLTEETSPQEAHRRELHHRFEGTDQSWEHLFYELHRTGADTYPFAARLLPR